MTSNNTSPANISTAPVSGVKLTEIIEKKILQKQSSEHKSIGKVFSNNYSVPSTPRLSSPRSSTVGISLEPELKRNESRISLRITSSSDSLHLQPLNEQAAIEPAKATPFLRRLSFRERLASRQFWGVPLHRMSAQLKRKLPFIISPEPQDEGQENWRIRLDYYLMACGSTISVYSFAMYPVLSFKHGPVTFLLAYVMANIFVGYPLFFLETFMGQFSAKEPIALYRSLSPFFGGVGWAIFIANIIGLVSRVKFIGSACLYFAFAIPNEIPHKGTATIFLGVPDGLLQFFWKTLTADPKYGWGGLGNFDYPLPLSIIAGLSTGLFVTSLPVKWMVVFKYATLPMAYGIMIISALILLSKIDSCGNFYQCRDLAPTAQQFTNISLWVDACVMIIHNLGLARGTVYLLGKYTAFRRIIWDRILVVLIINIMMSLFFSLLLISCGGLHGTEGTRNLLKQHQHYTSSEYIYILMPLVVRVYGSQYWLAAIYWGILCIEVGALILPVKSFIVGIVTIIKSNKQLMELYFPNIIVTFILLLTCSFLCFQGGHYILQIITWASNFWIFLPLALIECLVIGWAYGWKRMEMDLRLSQPYSYYLFLYLRLSIEVITPTALFLALLHAATIYANDFFNLDYPAMTNGAYAFGWIIGLTTLACIPVVMVRIALSTRTMTLKDLLKPKRDAWVPKGDTREASIDWDSIHDSESLH